MTVVVACACRRIPLAAPGGAAVHLRGIARGFSEHASVEAWVGRVDPGSRGPSARLDLPVRVLPRGRLPGALRKRRAWDAAVDGRAARNAALRWHRQHPVALLYERAALFSRIGRLPGVPRVVELNAPLAWEAAWFEGLAPSPALLAAEARSLADADLVVVVSEALGACAQRRGVPADRVLVLPNGAEGVPGFDPDGPLGYAGTFKPWQGLLDSVPALAALGRPLELWGDGPDRVPLLRALRAAGLPHAWRGWASPSDLAAARAAWSAAWVPRGAWPPPGSEALAATFGEPVPDRYFSPLKEAEAAACGLPIWRGAGTLLDPPARPRSWGQVAGAVLAALAERGIGDPDRSWLNGPRSDGNPGAA